jgi:hypothetical protein
VHQACSVFWMLGDGCSETKVGKVCKTSEKEALRGESDAGRHIVSRHTTTLWFVGISLILRIRNLPSLQGRLKPRPWDPTPCHPHRPFLSCPILPRAFSGIFVLRAPGHLSAAQRFISLPNLFMALSHRCQVQHVQRLTTEAWSHP